MVAVFVEMSMSLDGYIAGPDDSQESPLGDGGERLHEWVFDLAAWREMQGLDGGKTNRDNEIVSESIERIGAHVMGRRMFDNGDGPWGDDPFEGYWGENPPFHGPVFVLTHHPREPLEMDGGTTFHFVTDGIETALERAEAAAGDRDVRISGGADVVRQYVEAGLVDEIQLQLVPVLFGDGIRLFEHLIGEPIELERTRVVESSDVTHLRFRVIH
ncbi:dihydrofolate reductase family protein (plasmid) [Haladaptatus sp. SPP-AMP-3]|uniref:dihydrofolate reductase family protein n=1 Tax=Haladaptatus sp. SPP-AMP-3 TaxID=3121295 RepID=UPI003C2CE8CC